MILIHLLTGLAFGTTSVVVSVHAGDGFLVGLLRYSVLGVAGMLLSAALSLLPVSGLVQLVGAAVKPRFRERAGAPHARHPHGGFARDVVRARDM